MNRNHLGEFYYTLIPKYQRQNYSIDKTIIDLFNTGLFNADIFKINKSLYDAIYPQSNIQRYLVHISRSISAKVCVMDHLEILQEFKEVY